MLITQLCFTSLYQIFKHNNKLNLFIIYSTRKYKSNVAFEESSTTELPIYQQSTNNKYFQRHNH